MMSSAVHLQSQAASLREVSRETYIGLWCERERDLVGGLVQHTACVPIAHASMGKHQLNSVVAACTKSA
jgi:hypothetical protein